MAAKQGLTAQIYQASEDTKRSLLSRAPAGIKSHSWLSNLNTTCTIKSAPPRTPEVMSLLSTKCGWLVKRNEQHVWQKRWCCVVPHTFLYYFEASPEVKTDEDGCQEAWSGGGVNVNGKLTVVVPFQNLDQDALNLAVREGYDEDGAGARSSFYASLPNFSVVSGGGNNGGAGGDLVEDGLHGIGSGGAVDWEESAISNSLEAGNNPGAYQFVTSNLQPVGIIDLECYSAVNRSKVNPTVLELAGDAITNPDLRSFYFQSATIEDADSWIKALLSDRHQSLKDETEAYRQVCDSFPLQLQACSEMIDAAEAKASEMEREAYSVRSAAEEGRRKVVSAVKEVLERKCWEACHSKKLKGTNGKNGYKGNNGGSSFGDDHSLAGSRVSRSGRSDCSFESKTSIIEEDPLSIDSVLDSQFSKMETNRSAFLRELEATLSSPSAVATSNVVPSVQTLVDYTSTIIASFSDLRVQLRKYEKDLRHSVEKDQTQLQALKGAIEGRDEKLADAEKKYSHFAAELKSELQASQREVEELSKQLDAHRMEFGMYQNATKTKLSELQQHKKILKREVIDLRKKIDECGSENTTVAHEYEKIKSSYQSEKERNATLERYIDRLEKQVGVQQNMMEMMSQTGTASFVGKVVGPGVTQCDSKDLVSISGMSVNSQHRRMNSCNGSVGGGSNMNGLNNSTPLKPRPLTNFPLPPGTSSYKNKALHDVSPLPTPTFFKEPVEKNLSPEGDDEEERDASNAYYRSETTSDLGSPGSRSGGAASPSHLKRSLDIIENSRLGSSDSVSANSLDNEQIECPQTPDRKTGRTYQSNVAEPSKTPLQSNSVPAITLLDGTEDEEPSHQNLKDVPTLDLNHNGSHDERMKIVSINDDLLAVAHMPPADTDRDDDDMDDNKSRVSDITEDRTQRQIDDDLAERRKILLAYVSGAGGSSTASTSMSSTQRRLETIENMLPNNRGNLPRVNSTEDVVSYGSGSSRLSVAQRARMEAESRSNSHRTPSPLKPRDDVSLSSNNIIQPHSPEESQPSSKEETIEQSGSFFSKLGRAIENAVDKSVLGVRLPLDDSYDYEYGDEDDVSETTTTLQERIAKQREQQVEFLKNKGLLEDESSLRGGAGGSSIGSPKTTPRRAVSKRGA